jgi:hypothetical protein
MSYAKKLFPSKMPAKIFCFNGFLQKCHFQCAIDDNVKVIHVLSSKSSGGCRTSTTLSPHRAVQGAED